MDWNEKVYVSTFISGLKGHVKDEFARIDRPATLNEAIDFAVKVDNRYHERLMEKRDNEAWRKGSHRPKGQYKSNDQRERTGAKHNDPYGLKPMELDATEGQGQSRGISQKERERRKREKLCYNCGKDATEQWYGQLNEHEIDELADHANNETDRLGRVNSESQYEATMEPIRERVRHALTHRVDGPDNTDQYNKPVSSIDQSNRVLIEIDPLNEEYGT
ncbi:unnamed protein product [Aspergillus oryzae]|nr:unnamed protein product [Aspergillus oryzae]